MRRFIFCVCLLWLVRIASAAEAGKLDGFDDFVNHALKDWKVPGAAVVVVRDGNVILSKGYGMRDLAKGLPVTPKTLFAIGSATKSFTVSTLGMLVDDGKLDWDKPVREYLPNFRMYDEFATERMTPRDLVTHRSGLPRHDMSWYNSPATRKEMFERLRYLEPGKDFRTTFQYQNLMFMTAGYLASQVADRPYEQLVKDRIFEPLAMRRSNLSVLDSEKSDDYALPYLKVKEEAKPVAFRNIDQIAPAGSINSCVEDMAHYLLMHMNKGTYEGKQVLSASNVAQMQTPQMVIPGELRYTELGHQTYGMGLFITTYRGHKLVHHGGNIDGFSALVTFMPQDNIGLVILTNMNGSPLPAVISYGAYDRLLGIQPVDWTARLKDDEKRQKTSEEDAKKQGFTARKPNTVPAHQLKEYAGDYENPGYGAAHVTLDMDGLHMSYNNLMSRLEHFHYDVFEAPKTEGVIGLGGMKFVFHTNLQGDVDSFSSPIEPSVKDIVFTRLPDRSMMTHAALSPLAGLYQLGPQTMSISLRGETTLTLMLPGQPVYELAPTGGLKFNIKGLNGYSLEFKKNESGAVDQLVFFQPNGTLAAKRK